MGIGRASVLILHMFTMQQWILLGYVCVYTEYKLVNT